MDQSALGEKYGEYCTGDLHVFRAFILLPIIDKVDLETQVGQLFLSILPCCVMNQ